MAFVAVGDALVVSVAWLVSGEKRVLGVWLIVGTCHGWRLRRWQAVAA